MEERDLVATTRRQHRGARSGATGERRSRNARCASAWQGRGSSAPCTRVPPASRAPRWPASPRRPRSARARPPRASGRRRPMRRRSNWRLPRTSTSSTSARRTTCTPKLAALALEHGKHVVCEKPLAVGPRRPSADRGRGGAGRVATVPFVYRFHPVVREARARVQSGELGPVRLSTAATCRTGSPPPRTITGASTPSSAARRARSPTSARTGATWSSSSPATASPRSARRRPFAERAAHDHAQAFAIRRGQRRSAPGRHHRGRRDRRSSVPSAGSTAR